MRNLLHSHLLGIAFFIILGISNSLHAEIFDCNLSGELAYGALIPGDNPTVELRKTAILEHNFVINLSGFIPQDKKVLVPVFANGLRLGVKQDFQFKLLMIQDYGSGNILAYLSTFREDLMGRTSTVLGTARMAISVMNDHFAFGLIQKPYWFNSNQHEEAQISVNVQCLLQDNRDPRDRELVPDQHSN